MANFNYDPDLPDSPYNDPGACATAQESCQEYADNVGMDEPDREWIATPFDSWERNPHYTGKPGRHPEADYDEGPDAGGLCEGGNFCEGAGQEKEHNNDRSASGRFDDEIFF